MVIYSILNYFVLHFRTDYAVVTHEANKVKVNLEFKNCSRDISIG
jgi:hypothetical protein